MLESSLSTMPSKPVKPIPQEEPIIPVEASGVFPEEEAIEEHFPHDGFDNFEEVPPAFDPAVELPVLEPEVLEAPPETYAITDPQGIIHVTDDFYFFCQDKGLNGPAMAECLTGQRRHYNGWSVRRIR